MTPLDQLYYPCYGNNSDTAKRLAEAGATAQCAAQEMMERANDRAKGRDGDALNAGRTRKELLKLPAPHRVRVR